MNIPNYFEPTEAEANCLALIRKNESGGTYNILCGGGHFQDYSKFPEWSGFRGSHAAGAYQLQPATEALCRANNPLITDFSPIAQDMMALWLLRTYGPNATITWAASGPYPNVT